MGRSRVSRAGEPIVVTPAEGASITNATPERSPCAKVVQVPKPDGPRTRYTVSARVFPGRMRRLSRETRRPPLGATLAGPLALILPRVARLAATVARALPI